MVYFSDISIQSTIPNKAVAQMFAHPNNERIWRKEKELLLAEVKGNQLLIITHSGSKHAQESEQTNTHACACTQHRQTP